MALIIFHFIDHAYQKKYTKNETHVRNRFLDMHELKRAFAFNKYI